jgi:hypothetical protein
MYSTGARIEEIVAKTCAIGARTGVTDGTTAASSTASRTGSTGVKIVAIVARTWVIGERTGATIGATGDASTSFMTGSRVLRFEGSRVRVGRL